MNKEIMAKLRQLIESEKGNVDYAMATFMPTVLGGRNFREERIKIVKEVLNSPNLGTGGNDKEVRVLLSEIRRIDNLSEKDYVGANKIDVTEGKKLRADVFESLSECLDRISNKGKAHADNDNDNKSVGATSSSSSLSGTSFERVSSDSKTR